MSEAIVVALISGACAIAAQMVIANRSRRDMDAKLDKQQAVMSAHMEDLTREVREHNNFARRMPVVEEQIKVINHRIEDLEKGDKHA